MVGVDPGISRHDAMTLAEAGADYVAFGAPAHLKDRDKAREPPRRADRLVGGDFPGALRRLRRGDGARKPQTLAQAGADFVAVTLPAGQPRPRRATSSAAIAAAIVRRGDGS